MSPIAGRRMIATLVLLLLAPAPLAAEKTEPLYEGKTAAQWRTVLHRSDPRAKAWAARALVTLGQLDDEVTRELASAIDGNRYVSSNDYIKILGNDRAVTTPLLLSLINDSREGVRQMGILLLGGEPFDDRALEIRLVELIDDDNVALSASAARALGIANAPAESTIQRLAEELASSDQQPVIGGCAAALAKQKRTNRTALPQLLKVLKSTGEITDWNLTEIHRIHSALMVLESIESPSPEVIATLRKLEHALAERDITATGTGVRITRYDARKTRLRISPFTAEDIDELIRELGGLDYQCQSAAAKRLAELGEAAIPSLLAALRRNDANELRKHATYALMQMRRDDAETTAAFIEIFPLADTDSVTRSALVKALSRRLDATGASGRPIMPFLQHERADVRKQAVRSLKRQNAPPEDMALLADALDTPHAEVRKYLVTLLKPLTPAATTRLGKILDESEADVRLDALRALADPVNFGRTGEASEQLWRIVEGENSGEEKTLALPALAGALSFDENTSRRIVALLDEDPSLAPAVGDACGRWQGKALDLLIARLSSGDAGTSEAAAVALIAAGTPAAQRLFALCEDTSLGERARETLPKIKAAGQIDAAVIRTGLNSPCVEVRRWAIAALGTMFRQISWRETYGDGVQYLDLIEQALGDTDLDVRRAASYQLTLLAKSQDPRVIPLVIQCRADPEIRRNSGGVRYLGRAMAEALCVAAQSQDVQRRVGALGVLSAHYHPDAVPLLVAALDSRNPDIRNAAVAPLGTYSGLDDDAAIALGKLLGDDRLYDDALRALFEAQPAARAAGPYLLATARRRGFDADGQLARALLKCDGEGPETHRFVRQQLAQASPQARAILIEALGEARSPRVAPLLAPALQDDSTRGAAIAALQKLGPMGAPVLPSLVALLNDPRAQVRVDALVGMAPMREAAAEAVPAMIACLDDRHLDVRYAAHQALGATGRAGSPAIERLLQIVKSNLHGDKKVALSTIGRIDNVLWRELMGFPKF